MNFGNLDKLEVIIVGLIMVKIKQRVTPQFLIVQLIFFSSKHYTIGGNIRCRPLKKK